MTKEKQETITIPASIADKIKKRIDGTGFESISAYVAYVLQEVLSEDEDSENDFSKEDEEKVKDRLRALGYLE